MAELLPTRHNAGLRRFVSVCLGLFLLLLIYDGALRKWWFPAAEQMIFIAKDVLLLVIFLIAVTVQRGRLASSIPAIVKLMFLLYTVWVFFEATNFRLPNLLVPLWGTKAHLLYATIIFLLPICFVSVEDLLETLTRIYPWLVIPVCCVCMLQLVSADTSFINQSLKGGTEAAAYFGDAQLVRVTGTFSYISGMASFIQCAGLLGLGLFVAGARSGAFLLALGLTLSLLPSTGSRAVILVMALGASIIFLTAVAARQIGLRRFLFVMTASSVLMALSFYAQDETWLALQQRVEAARHDQYRVFTTFTNAFDYFSVSGLFGYGSGSTNFGAIALSKGIVPFSWLPVGGRFEQESGRIVIELGILGWFLSLAMRLAFFFWALKLALRGRSQFIRSVAVIGLPVLALGVYQGNGVFAPPLGAFYYWFCVAMLGLAQYEHDQFVLRRSSPAGRSLPETTLP